MCVALKDLKDIHTQRMAGYTNLAPKKGASEIESVEGFCPLRRVQEWIEQIQVLSTHNLNQS